MPSNMFSLSSGLKKNVLYLEYTGISMEKSSNIKCTQIKNNNLKIISVMQLTMSTLKGVLILN